jgi:hypothetical protein
MIMTGAPYVAAGYLLLRSMSTAAAMNKTTIAVRVDQDRPGWGQPAEPGR